MRAPALIVALSLMPLGMPTSAYAQEPAEAEAEDPDVARAKAAFTEARTAYKLGDMASAAPKFEEAYALSELPAILYNIGLAYKRWYDSSKDPAHLNKAKVVFENFLIEVQKDPGLGSAEEVQNLLTEIEEAEAKAKAEADAQAEAEAEAARAEAEREAAAREGETGPTDTGPREPVGPDPGKGLKLGGLVTLGIGVAAAAGGAAGFFAMNGRAGTHQSALNDITTQATDAGCPQQSSSCEAFQAEADRHVAEGNDARSTGIVLGLGLGIGGAVVAATGGALYAVGAKKTKQWKGGTTLSAAPVLAPGFAGAAARLRF